MNNDLISREALKKRLNEMFETFDVVLFDDIIATIDNAPTVEIATKLQPKQGEWIRTALYGQTCLECNQCGKADFDIKYDNFCPNCGAKMKGGAE